MLPAALIILLTFPGYALAQNTNTKHRFFVFLVNESAFKNLKQRHMNSPEIKNFLIEKAIDLFD